MRDISALYRLPHTSQFFVIELQIFLSGSNRVKIWRDFSLPHASRFFVATNRVSTSISTMLENTLVHVTLKTVPHALVEVHACPDKLSCSTAH